MKAEKQEAIRRLIEIFGREWPRKNHIIVIDMLTGAYRVDHMLTLELPDERDHEVMSVAPRRSKSSIRTKLDQSRIVETA